MADINEETGPVFVERFLKDKIKWFAAYEYHYRNVKTLEQFHDVVSKAFNLKFTSEEERHDFQFACLHFRLMGSKPRVRSIAIKAEYFLGGPDSFNDFMEIYEKITSGNFKGSDAVDFKELELVYEYFTLGGNHYLGFGASDKMMFEVLNIFDKTSFHTCGKQCLLYIIQKLKLKKNIYNDIEKIDNKKLQDLSDIYKAISETYELKNNVNILLNTFKLKKSVADIFSEYKYEDLETIVIPDKRGNNINYKCVKLNLDLIDLVYYSNPKSDDEILKEDEELKKGLKKEKKEEKKKFTIIYDDLKKHFDILKGDLKTIDNLYISRGGQIINNNKLIFTPTQINTNTLATLTLDKMEYIFFDYETVIDFRTKSCMREYSLSILVVNHKQLMKLLKIDDPNFKFKDEKDGKDKKDDKDKVDKVDENSEEMLGEGPQTIEEFREKYCITFKGYDATNQFIKWILKNQEGTVFRFIGFNNSHFDNLILLDGLLKYQDLDPDSKDYASSDFNVSNVQYNGNELLDFKVCGRHSTFDIRKHITEGSLSKVCESFGVKCCKKKYFDHDLAQQEYLKGEQNLLDFVDQNKDVQIYNEFDVLATAVVFIKYQLALGKIKCIPRGVRLTDKKTIGSLIYSIFKANTVQYKFPKLKLKFYNDLNKYKIAGRVEMFNGVQKIEERMASPDACSLYPYNMAVNNVYYPHGELVETDHFVDDPELIGFYYCDIDQRNLKEKNLPLIYAKKTGDENIWDHDEILEDYLISTPMIDLLKRHGCKVTIKSGFYFTDIVKSCDLFKFILDLMVQKNQQDEYKRNNDPEYNSCLREVYKLLPNSMSGKLMEGLHLDKTTMINCAADYVAITKNKKKNVNCINSIGNKIFLSYSNNEEDEIDSQRPIFLGVLIYDYSKIYMYDYIISKIGLKNLVYTDTDAVKTKYKDFEDWVKSVNDNNVIVPHWKDVEIYDNRYKNHKIYEVNSKVFGSFEDELEDFKNGNNYLFYCLQKKTWFYGMDDKSKFRFKGLSGNSILLNLNEEFIDITEIKHRKNAKKGLERRTEKVYKLKDQFEDKIMIYNYLNDNEHLNIKNNSKDLFDLLFLKREARILTSSFQKIIKNAKRNVILEDEERFNKYNNRISMRYTIKTITI